MYDSDRYFHDKEAIKRALRQRLEEAGILRYKRSYGGCVWYLYERAGVLRELQIPKSAPGALDLHAQRIHIEGKWRLMYSLPQIEMLLSQSPTIEGQAERRHRAESSLRWELRHGCKSIGLEATKEVVDTFFRSLEHQHDDDFEGGDFDWENFEWDDIR